VIADPSPAGAPAAAPPPAANYDIRTRHAASLIEVAVTGSPHIDQLISALHVLGIELETSSGAALLLDLTDLLSVFRPEELVRVGHEIACSFAHVHRLALLVPRHRVTGLSERAAQRSGMDMRVFSALHLAHDWLRPGA
jgi:hypothetical protein